MSRPCASSAFALASTSKAVSVPSLSIRFANISLLLARVARARGSVPGKPRSVSTRKAPVSSPDAMARFRATTSRTFAAISRAVSPKCARSCSCSPDSPKRSSTAHDLEGVGLPDWASASATAPPRPPIVEPSSAVTSAPVSTAARFTMARSSGLTVWQFTTRTREPAVLELARGLERLVHHDAARHDRGVLALPVHGALPHGERRHVGRHDGGARRREPHVHGPGDPRGGHRRLPRLHRRPPAR